MLGMEWQERGVGVEDVIFIEINNSLLVQISSHCYAKIFDCLNIQTTKEFEQFENSATVAIRENTSLTAISPLMR